MFKEKNFKTVKILSIISAAFAVLSALLAFILYIKMKISFVNLEVLINLFFIIIGLVPSILLVLYFQKYYDHPKSKKLLITIFSYLAIIPVLTIFFNSNIFGASRSTVTLSQLVGVSLAFCSLGIKKNTKNNLFYIIPLSINIVFSLFSLLPLLTNNYYYDFYFNLFRFSEVFRIISYILICITLLLYMINYVKNESVVEEKPKKAKKQISLFAKKASNINTTTKPVEVKKQAKILERRNYENEEEHLKRQLKLGAITKEEYISLRSELMIASRRR